MAEKKYETKEDYLKAKSVRAMEYNAEKTCTVNVRLNKATDADIIEWMSSRDNKQGYIKELIRADMERQRNAT